MDIINTTWLQVHETSISNIITTSTHINVVRVDIVCTNLRPRILQYNTRVVDWNEIAIKKDQNPIKKSKWNNEGKKTPKTPTT